MHDLTRSGPKKFAPDPNALWQEGEFRIEREFTVKQLPFIDGNEQDQARHKARKETGLPQPTISARIE